MISSLDSNTVVRRTLIRTGVSVFASVATVLLIALALFGTDPGKTIAAGYATIIMLVNATICSALLTSVMSYKSRLPCGGWRRSGRNCGKSPGPTS